MNRLIKKILLFLIRLYQHTLSPDAGILKIFYPHGYCQFHPHCSQYCYQSLEKHGIIKGIYFSILRILRCHPWSRGGLDPVK